MQALDHKIDSVPSYDHVTQKLYRWYCIRLRRVTVVQEPTLGITIANDVLEQIASLTRASKYMHNVASQCHWIPFYSVFECLLIQKARGKHLNKHFGGFSQVDIGQAGDDMLTTRVDDVQEAHNLVVNCIKVDVMSLKEC